MSGTSSFLTPGRANKINLLCLLLCICWVLFLPLKKEIWYDESVSVLISKGISHTTPDEFAAIPTATAATVGQLNTAGNVFHATVVDNGNSFLYNILLHWFTGAFGNTLNVYVLFSKLCAVGALIAFFFLCGLFFDGTLFVSLGLLLFASDKIYWGMAHEVRAYEMGIFFSILTVTYCYKYLYRAAKPTDLLLTGLFAVGAVLSHYLSIYVVLVVLAYLVFTKKAALFAPKNLVHIFIPVLLIGIYFYCAFNGFTRMSSQNMALKEKVHESFSLGKAVLMSMKFTAVNFKIALPAFKDNNIIVAVSAFLVVAIYLLALKFSYKSEDKRNLHMMFLLGFSGSAFLALLAIKSQHYTALYSRYYSFCVPFSALFIAYALKVLFSNISLNKIVSWGLTAFVLLPCLVVFMLGIVKNKPELKYNHIAIAKTILKDNVSQLEVPDWNEAFLVSGFLPKDYNIQYTLNRSSHDFVLHKASDTENIPLVRNDH